MYAGNYFQCYCLPYVPTFRIWGGSFQGLNWMFLEMTLTGHISTHILAHTPLLLFVFVCCTEHVHAPNNSKGDSGCKNFF